MMITRIKRSGWPFSYDTSNYHGLKPSKFEWLKGESGTSDVTVYFDHDHMGGFSYDKSGLSFLLEKENNNAERSSFILDGFKSNKDRLKFLWLSESREIEGKVHNHVLKNADLFFNYYDAIFVHDREMIKKDNRFTYLPNGSNKHWITDNKIHKKTKLVSMINSGKK